MNRFAVRARVVFLLGWAVGASLQAALLDLDLRGTGGSGWRALHHVSAVETTPDGLRILIQGGDPYIAGPAYEFPPDQPLWVDVRLHSSEGGMAQLFFYQGGPSELQSVRFAVKKGEWQTVRAPLPALGKGFRFRFDPPGSSGSCLLARLSFSPRTIPVQPDWAKADFPELGKDPFVLTSGKTVLRHDRERWGSFRLEADGKEMAAGMVQPRVGYEAGASIQWFDFTDGAVVASREIENGFVMEASREEGGTLWHWRQTFRAGAGGAIDVSVQFGPEARRKVYFVPGFVLFAGAGSFGERKAQGLFAGLEYLDDEPSSSEADLRGPESRRQVPDNVKITFPLMAISARERYVALSWEMQRNSCALFDSPDRVFKSGGHVLGLLFPGSDSVNRVEGNLVPNDGEWLEAMAPWSFTCTLLSGTGSSVVPAIQDYVALRGLPEIPDAGTRDAYVRAAAAAWLDTPIREGALFRHAVAPSGFDPHPAADAAWMMDWLAGQTTDDTVRGRLSRLASQALANVNPALHNAAAVSHVRYPVASLVYGSVAENALAANSRAEQALRRFEPDGRILYRASAGRPDFGKTHFALDANGLTAQVVAALLENAMAAGDWELIAKAVDKLDAMNSFAGSVPRGAQTWEVPLHTPDILASAHLVQAYLMGFEATGRTEFIELAKHWAWTGVPFVYLIAPVDAPIGPYATIAVYGATHWEAPVWMGLPVQWCGLVYSDALFDLAAHDPSGPWLQIARGITASGIQQNYPAGHPHQGLLPDSFNLKAQSRNPADINPGTVQANAIRFFGARAYDRYVSKTNGWIVHAPGALEVARDEPGKLRFRVKSWVAQPWVLVAGSPGEVQGQSGPVRAVRTANAEWMEVTRRAGVDAD